MLIMLIVGASGAVAIAEARVTAVASTWNAARTQIHTTVTLDVQQYDKGGLGARTLAITYLGGTVDDIT